MDERVERWSRNERKRVSQQNDLLGWEEEKKEQEPESTVVKKKRQRGVDGMTLGRSKQTSEATHSCTFLDTYTHVNRTATANIQAKVRSTIATATTPGSLLTSVFSLSPFFSLMLVRH